jgi:hypothetical protein
MNQIPKSSSTVSPSPNKTNLEQKNLSGAENKTENKGKDLFDSSTKVETVYSPKPAAAFPKLPFEVEKSPLLNSELAANFGKSVQSLSSRGIFVSGEKIDEEQLRNIGCAQNIIPSFLEYAQTRGVLAPQAAMTQLQNYISTIPPDRKLPFTKIVNLGSEWAKNSGHDPASPTGQSQIALTLVFSPDSTALEKGLGLDLFLATSRFLEQTVKNS